MNREPSRLRRFYRETTRPLRAVLSVWKIFHRGYGHTRSARRQESLDGNNREIPWFTYPALEYLRQLDFSSKAVFEFGAGHSTIYWCSQAAHVVSVENSRAWYERIRPRLGPNAELYLVEEPGKYPRLLADRAEQFDVIVIDGIEREACCVEALKKLRPGGLIILDNSDRDHACAAVLRRGGLLEVDMTGFGPINGYTWTTSFFFHREFAFSSREDRQPVRGIGSLG
ncbi:MAG: hypothetical protein JWM35_2639 [Verrucomicrobia bacterium]|nr:hypothetical protein [Verrucomicrobiota bacterium]